VEFKDKIFIFEFKMDGNGTAEDALKQIDNKDYAGKFNLSDKKVFKIGVEMDNEKRNVKKWVYSPRKEE
ncbi:MAG: PD-(D/E)XK nuclease domain-containing protein, partial [Bacteroidales bacterium]|nr:PD-(D/E)XK nuclease domain-containing protein [Bacteroidales bacterium]